jgi:hypothetical protein
MVTNTQVRGTAIVSAQVDAELRDELLSSRGGRPLALSRDPSGASGALEQRQYGGDMTDDSTTIRGGRQLRSTWFGGACVARGGPARTRSLGSMWGGSLGGHTVDEDFGEHLGVMKGPLSGDIALGHLGRTAAERADDRARAESARVDATLASLGVRPRRRRIGL